MGGQEGHEVRSLRKMDVGGWPGRRRCVLELEPKWKQVLGQEGREAGGRLVDQERGVR